MEQKYTKSMSEVRLGGPSAVCTVCTVRTQCAPVCSACTGVHNGEIADGNQQCTARQLVLHLRMKKLKDIELTMAFRFYDV
jgi:hypothetical protein